MTTEATVDREQVLDYAQEHGASAASERYGVPGGTIRSWRSRADRKVEDHRTREDPEPAVAVTDEPERVEILIPKDDSRVFDELTGEASRDYVRATATLLDGSFHLYSQGGVGDVLVDLPAGVAAKLEPGALVCVAHRDFTAQALRRGEPTRPDEYESLIVLRPLNVVDEPYGHGASAPARTAEEQWEQACGHAYGVPEADALEDQRYRARHGHPPAAPGRVMVECRYARGIFDVAPGTPTIRLRGGEAG